MRETLASIGSTPAALATSAAHFDALLHETIALAGELYAPRFVVPVSSRARSARSAPPTRRRPTASSRARSAGAPRPTSCARSAPEEPALVELVAEAEGRVIGHIAWSPVRPDRLAPGVVAFGLAPVSVEPALQRSGAGGALVRAGFAACRERGVGLTFVLGHASYYPRFGFEPALARGFRYRSADFDGSFFVRELAPGAAAGGGGLVHFHPAFDRF